MGAFLAVTLTLLTLFATGVFAWAWRGRRVDDHPLCLKCGFDLTGKPTDSIRCAECGADVTAGRAIRIGHRQRRTAWAMASGTLLLLLVGSAVVAGIITHRKGNLQAYKPLWWLEHELADRQTSGAA